MALFPQPQVQPNPMMSFLQAAKGDPRGVFNQLMRTNPRFAQFVRANQGKTPEQIASENGIDYSAVRSLMG